MKGLLQRITGLPFAFCLLLATAASGAAPAGPGPATPAAAGTPAALSAPSPSLVPLALPVRGDSDYTVGPDDVLEVKIYDEEDLSRTTQVTSRGTIALPLLKDVHVAGLTASQIAAKLEALYGADYLHNPQAFVSVKEFRSKTVQVLGAVKNPGVYTLRGRSAVLDVLGLAGGISEAGGASLLLLRPPEAALDPENARKRELASGSAAFKEGIEPITVDVHRLLVEGDVGQNLEVKGGDTVFVPRGGEIYVLGEVRNPGSVKFEEGMTLTQAISKTNGFTKTASKGRVQIVRVENEKKTQFDVNVKRIEAGKERDFVLQSRDLVVVPESIF